MRETALPRRSLLAADCHALLDLEGRFATVSDDLAACLGSRPDRLVGIDLECFIDGETPRVVIQDLWRTLARGDIWSAALKLRGSGDSELWMTLTIAPDTSRGRTKAYLAQFRPAFERDIEHARYSFGRVADGAGFDRGRCLGAGPATWIRRLFLEPREGGLVRSGICAVGVALGLLVFLAVWPGLADGTMRTVILTFAILALLGGTGLLMLDRRQSRRECSAVRDLIDRIAEGDTDAGSGAPDGADPGGLRGALRGLQIRLSMAAAGFVTSARDAGWFDERVRRNLELAERVHRVETRCSDLATLVARGDGAFDSGAGAVPDRQWLAALLERVEAMSSTIRALERASLESRVLSLNLALIAERVDVNGLDRVNDAARSVAHETIDGVARMRQELDRLKRDLQAAIEALSVEEPSRQGVADALHDGLAELFEDLSQLQVAAGRPPDGECHREGVAAGACETGHGRVTPVPSAESDRGGRKVARLRAVGATPVPRVGRGRSARPLEDDWRA